MNDIDEQFLHDTDKDDLKRFYKKYPDRFEALQDMPLAKIGSGIQMDNQLELGRLLERWEYTLALHEAIGAVPDLGLTPAAALDIITLSYGTDPINFIAKTQMLARERGEVWYYDVVAGDTAGNITAGDRIAQGKDGNPTVPRGYAGAVINDESLGNTVAATLTYAGTLGVTPIRAGTVTFKIALSGSTMVEATEDNMKGSIFGVDIQVAINYTTGVYTITMLKDPDTYDSIGALVITATYEQDFEKSSDIRSLDWDLTSKLVRAVPYALKSSQGMFKNFDFNSQWGMSSFDNATRDIVNAINTEVLGALIVKMVAQAVDTTDWDYTPDSGVAPHEWRKSYKLAMARSKKKMSQNAGRGEVNFAVAGSDHCEIMSTLPGWVSLYDSSVTAAAYLFGTLDGMPVVKVTDANILAATKVIFGYRGAGFEGACTHAPYMPLTSTGLLPAGPNPLVKQKAVAAWTAVDVLVPKFLTAMTVSNVPNN